MKTLSNELQEESRGYYVFMTNLSKSGKAQIRDCGWELLRRDIRARILSRTVPSFGSEYTSTCRGMGIKYPSMICGIVHSIPARNLG